MPELRHLAIVVVAALQCTIAVNALSCLDESGNPVDHFQALKYPGSGEYDYFGDGDKEFKHSSHTLETTKGAIGETLMQIYADKGDKVAYIMYNDEDPSEHAHDSRAHSKGVFAFDKKQGFWLIHSVPRFPPTASDGWSGGMPSYTYGQSFLCITFGIDELENVAKQISVIGPAFYDNNNPKGVGSLVPTFQDLVDDVTDKTATLIKKVKSAGGATFTSFAEGKEWDHDLYEELVAPELDSDLMTETWQNGAKSNVMPTYCKPDYKYEVHNIQDVKGADGTEWKSTKDHSKWAVSTAGSRKKFVCIGGINRQKSQDKRGGGTVCQSDAALWSAMQDRITSYEKCGDSAFVATRPAFSAGDKDILDFLTGDV